tara:strand:+ start:489 stop:662 length:174 start_codon:yes stop_codon:yes gene_type:complete
MIIKDLARLPTEHLDAYCERLLGHNNWALMDGESLVDDPEVHSIVIFYNEPHNEEEK